MILFPAIDLKNGSCVRLVQGKMEDATIFNENPLGVHKPWNYIKKYNYKKLKVNCPEINEIFGK